MSSSIAVSNSTDEIPVITTDEVDTFPAVEATTTSQQQQQQQQLKSLSLQATGGGAGRNNNNDESITANDDNEEMLATLTLQDITETPVTAISVDGDNKNSSSSATTTSTNIPKVKFIDDIALYIQAFLPYIVTAELLIGAYTQLHTKYKLSETSLLRKQEHLKEKVPELEKSLVLVQSLIQKQENNVTSGIVRYNLVDSIYAKAEVDYTIGIVYLWLGANVMLEYTYEEAMQFLQTNYTRATSELQNTNTDLSFIRDQIVTTEVNISRIYNYDVRQKRDTKRQPITT